MGINSKWEVFVVESADISQRLIDITPECRDKSLQLALNRSGAFNCKLPLSTKAYQYVSQPIKYGLEVVKNDTTVWSGMLWDADVSLSGNSISLSSVGWFETLNYRYLSSPIASTTVQAGDMALFLLAAANAQRDTWIDAGSNTDASASRIIELERWANIGEEIINLSDIEDGFDFEIDPSTRAMNIKDSADYVDNTSIIFEYDIGNENLTSFDFAIAGSEMRSQVIVANDTEAFVADGTTESEYQLFQEIISVGSQDETLMQAYANAEVATRQYPRVSYKFNPKGSSPTSGAFSFFEDYGLGDKIYVSASKENVVIDQVPQRLFGANIQIDNNGNERVADIQTTFQGT